MAREAAEPQRNAPVARVLICDDDALVRSLLILIVERERDLAVAGEASDGDEAVAQAVALRPDVVLLDLVMPRRSGLEVLPELCERVPDAAVVVLSGFMPETVEETVIGLGAYSYVSKGSTPEELARAIRLAAAHGKTSSAPDGVG